jgi:catechol 2,3-dioxygenase-like lactoylglutathione lyase family enzyme
MGDTFRITHVYKYATDLAAIRAFYEGLLGLPVIEHNDDFVEFKIGVSLTFLKTATKGPNATTFSSFPGWDGGQAEQALCSVLCTREQLEATQSRLAAAGATFTQPELRDGAWEMRALDPLGNTVEMFAVDEG